MISIFIRTIIIYVILNIMLKIMGKRQIGELEVNELVSTLLISEIAAIPIGDNDIPLIYAIIPILFISSLEIFLSALKNKWHGLKHVVEGEPVYIIYKGRLKQDVLRKNRISINEILTEMRIQGIADLSDVRYALLEQNGKLSFLKESDSPKISRTLVVDTTPDMKVIKEAGLNMKWLNKKLAERGVALSDVFLMTVNEDGEVSIIKKEKEK